VAVPHAETRLASHKTDPHKTIYAACGPCQLYLPVVREAHLPLLTLPIPSPAISLPNPPPGDNPYFSDQNDVRNPKMGSKQSVTGPTH